MRFTAMFLTVIAASAEPSSNDSNEPKYCWEKEYQQILSKPVSFDLPITCTAQTLAIAGYAKGLNPDAKPLVRVDVKVDEAPTIWKVTVHGDTANVIINGGGYERILTETWTVVSNTKTIS
jgi:hypothetical protein